MMNRRTRLALIALSVVAVAGAVILIYFATRNRIIEALNWNDYVGRFTNRDFENSFKVKVHTKYYTTNEEAYSFVASHQITYDIVFPSDYMMDRLIREERLEQLPLQVANFNAAVIDQRAINAFREAGWDKYCVPYLHGNSGFAVDTRKVGKMPQDVSWRWLGSPEFTGRIIVIDDPRQVLVSVLMELGYDANSVRPNELGEAVRVLRTLRSKVVEFTGDSVKESARAGSADVAFAWSGDALQLEGDLKNWRYGLPKAGGVRFQDGVCLIRSAPHKEMAIQYLNFLLDPKVHVDILETTLYPTTNRAARDLASERYRKIESTASEDDVKTQRLRDLDQPSLDAIRRAWEAVKR